MRMEVLFRRKRDATNEESSAVANQNSYCVVANHAFHFVLKSFAIQPLNLWKNIYHLDVSGQPDFVVPLNIEVVVFFKKQRLLTAIKHLLNAHFLWAKKWTKTGIHLPIWSIVPIFAYWDGKNRVPKGLKNCQHLVLSPRCCHTTKMMVINFLENEDIVFAFLWLEHLNASSTFAYCVFLAWPFTREKNVSRISENKASSNMQMGGSIVFENNESKQNEVTTENYPKIYRSSALKLRTFTLPKK